MRALGLGDTPEYFQPEDVEKYARLFGQPLSPSSIQILASLFGWTVPEFGVGDEPNVCVV